MTTLDVYQWMLDRCSVRWMITLIMKLWNDHEQNKGNKNVINP